MVLCSMPNRMLTPDELETANTLLRDIFYAVTRQDGTFDDTIEQFLDEKVESPAMAVVRKLATSNEQPSWEERIALTRWISFQELRTPLQRGGIEQIAGKIIKQTMGSGENVYLRGFGSFIVKRRAKKIGRIISRNTTIVIPAHSIPAFMPAKVFSNKIKNVKAKSKQTSEAVD